MKNVSRIFSIVSLVTLILVGQSDWKYSSPLIPEILILIIFGSAVYEVYSFVKTKEKKVKTLWVSTILFIVLITLMVNTFSFFKGDFLIVKNRTTWKIGNYKIDYYEHIFKRPKSKKQSYNLYKFGLFKTLYKEIDGISFKDTIDHKVILFPKTNIQFDKTTLKVNVP